MFEVYDENELGIDYVVGDIHGCFSRLENMLDDVNFDREVDRLFFVGDLVDRGPESEMFLDFLKKPWAKGVRGNHDNMVLDFCYQSGSWRENAHFDKEYRNSGGAWNIDGSYQLTIDAARAVERMPYLIEYRRKNGDKIVIVHADLPEIGLAETKRVLSTGSFDPMFAAVVDCLVWSRDRLYGERTDWHEHMVVCGHSTLPRPIMMEHNLFLDTGAVYDDGYFTLLRLSDMTLLKESRDVPTEAW